MRVVPITQQELDDARIVIDSDLGGIHSATKGTVSKRLKISIPRAANILEKLRRNIQVNPKYDETAVAPSITEQKALEMENQKLRRKVEDLLSQRVLDQRYEDFVSAVANTQRREYPKWALEPKGSSRKMAMPIAPLADWHFDETVDPAQVEWRNKYNREIAVGRLKRWVNKVIVLCDEYFSGVQYPGIVVPMLGDMLSGFIHEELEITNDAPMTDGVLFWADQLGAAFDLLIERYGKVFVPVVVGNHPRLSKKPRSKGGVRDNFDWLLAGILARDYARAKNDKIQFKISDSFDCHFRVYKTNYLATHGDQFKGGSGIAAALSPMMIGDARKRKRSQAMGNPHDVMICGHWHQRITLRNIKVSNCFPPGTMVTIGDGTRVPIETISIGDRVVSREGLIREVINVMSRNVAEPLVNIRLGSAKSDLRCTESHRLWAIKGNSLSPQYPDNGGWKHGIHNPVPGWIEAKNLSPGDYIHIPCVKETRSNLDPKYGKDFFRMLGLYLAEGCLGGRKKKDGSRYKHKIEFCFGNTDKERGYAEFVASVIEKYYGYTPSVKQVKKGKAQEPCWRTYVCNSEIVKHISDLCGSLSWGKKMSSDVMLSNPELQLSLLIGWLEGDGTTSKRSYRGGRLVSGTTVSVDMFYQLMQIALRCGLSPNPYKLRNGGPRLRDTYSIGFTANDATMLSAAMNEHTGGVISRDATFKSIYVNGECYQRISHVWLTNYSGPVYNLTVDTDHTYIADGVGAKNCGKGYDEYAYKSNFDYDVPSQSIWLDTPEHGITVEAPVFVKPEKEGWEREIRGDEAFAA